MVKVITSGEALRQLESLPPEIVARMVKLYERLENWPQINGAKPLTGSLAGHWRLRTGDYRLQFRIEGVTVIVEKVGHRDRFYER